MMKGLKILGLITLLITAFSCKRESVGGYGILSQDNLESVSLALGVGADVPVTKGDPLVLIEMDEENNVGRFRGVDALFLFPFASLTPLTSESEYASLSKMSVLPAFYSVMGNSRSHLYPKEVVLVPRGTGTVLAYARAAQRSEDLTVEHRHAYGSLSPVGLNRNKDHSTTSDLGFDAVPIYSGTSLPQEGTNIAQVLTNIVGQVSFTGEGAYCPSGSSDYTNIDIPPVKWSSEMENDDFRGWFEWMTNKGQLIPGSGTNVEYMLSELYEFLSTYECDDHTELYYELYNHTFPVVFRNNHNRPMTVADLYNGLRDEILGRIEENLEVNGTTVSFKEADNNLHAYPASRGLPDGAAVIRWNGVEYTAVADQLDGMAPLTAYCYPPELWYFANTTIKTSKTDLSEYYEDTEANKGKTWAEIKDLYTLYTDGPTVKHSTLSVALEDPLHFSCSMLRATVKAESASLTDAAGQSIAVTDEKFPLTGVILGGQRNLRFDFSPKTTGDEYFMYDNQFSNDTNGYFVYLTDQESGVFRSFVSETVDGQDVYFCLEFLNNCNETFVGAEGNILPGSKFYLVGKLDKPGNEDRENGLTSVFMRDHVTDVKCLIKTLKEAHNGVPDMEAPRITLGIRTQITWQQTTPATLILS